MFRVRSLNTMVVGQFIVVVLPVMLVAIFQALADARRSALLDTAFQRQELAHAAAAQYKVFVNGAVDAVDTGRVGATALESLGRSADTFGQLSALEPALAPPELLGKLQRLAQAVRVDATLQALLPFRGQINEIEEAVRAVDALSEADHRKTVLDSITSPAYQRNLVVASLLLTLGLSAFLVRMIVRGLTRPLEQSVRLANCIAHGEIRGKTQVNIERDLGGLLTSLQQMNESLYTVIGEVHQGSDVVASSSQALLESSGAASSSAEGLAQSIAQARGLVEGMTAAILQMADQAEATLNGARQAREIAVEGDRNMNASLAMTERIVGSVKDSTLAIEELDRSMQRIRGVTGIIEGIARQTNLLALNATIEAARAGESGRGFAVVADEVRKLAERTARSTADIASTVEEVSAETHDAAESMARVGAEVEEGALFTRQTAGVLKRVVEAADVVSEAAERIAETARAEVRDGASAVERMLFIDDTNQHNARRVVEVRQSAEALASTAHNLRTTVGRFHLS